jgi:hypothetical protein
VLGRLDDVAADGGRFRRAFDRDDAVLDGDGEVAGIAQVRFQDQVLADPRA